MNWAEELSGPIPRILTKDEAESGEEVVKIGCQQDEEEIISHEDLDTKWEKYGREYSKVEARLILSKCIQVGVEVAFRNHVYWYHHELYKQSEGGARLTGVVVRVTKDRWEEIILRELEKKVVKLVLWKVPLVLTKQGVVGAPEVWVVHGPPNPD